MRNSFYYCECDSYQCALKIKITDQQYAEINKKFLIISDKCKTPPNPQDEFVEQRKGYKLFKIRQLAGWEAQVQGMLDT